MQLFRFDGLFKHALGEYLTRSLILVDINRLELFFSVVRSCTTSFGFLFLNGGSMRV